MNVTGIEPTIRSAEGGLKVVTAAAAAFVGAIFLCLGFYAFILYATFREFVANSDGQGSNNADVE